MIAHAEDDDMTSQRAYRVVCDADNKECLASKRALAKENMQSLLTTGSMGDDDSKLSRDWDGHTAFGMAPPPLQGRLTYDEVLLWAKSDRVATVQIAPMHDTVFVTTPDGHRWSSPIKDEDFPGLLADAMGDDGALPFEVLPMDPMKAQLREVAKVFRNVGGALYLADQLDLLPWDTTSYSSIREREEAMEARARGETPKQTIYNRKPVGELLRWLYAKATKPFGVGKDGQQAIDRTTAAGEGGDAAERGAGSGRGGHIQDEALRRVLGLTSWDAAAELKAKLKSKVLSSDVHQSVVDVHHKNVELTAKLNRQIKDRVLRSDVHQSVVEAHERNMAALRENHGRIVDAHQQMVCETVKATPWATPHTLDKSIELPPLEDLFAKAWKVVDDGVVAQYIAATATLYPAEGVGSEAVTASVLKQLKTPEDSPVYVKSMVGVAFPSAFGYCRLCPEFSEHYGARVYICKRLIAEPA